MSKPPILVRFLVRIYIYSLLIFGLLRFWLFYYANTERLAFFDKTVLKSFLIGVQFDSVIIAYILLLPLILLFIQSFFQIPQKYIQKFVVLYLSIVFPVLIFITIADIPYFKFFRNRLSEASFQWFGSLDIVVNMIIGNTINLFVLIVALIAVFLSGLYIYKFTRNKIINYDWDAEYKSTTKVKYTLYFVLLAAFCVMGMRGTISHPIRQGDAF